MKMSKKSKIVIYILLGLVAIYFLAPFIYMLFSAFKTEGEAIAYPPKLLPAEWHFENFINAWKSQPFGTYRGRPLRPGRPGFGAEVGSSFGTRGRTPEILCMSRKSIRTAIPTRCCCWQNRRARPVIPARCPASTTNWRRSNERYDSRGYV